MKLISLVTSLVLTLSAASAGASMDSPLRDAGIARGLQLAGVDDPANARASAREVGEVGRWVFTEGPR